MMTYLDVGGKEVDGCTLRQKFIPRGYWRGLTFNFSKSAKDGDLKHDVINCSRKEFSDVWDVVGGTDRIPVENGIIDRVRLSLGEETKEFIDGLFYSMNRMEVSELSMDMDGISEADFRRIDDMLFTKGFCRFRTKDGWTEYDKPTVAIYAKGDWSTGSIVRDLAAVSKNWIVKLWDWDKPDPDIRNCLDEVQAAIGMTMYSPARIPWFRTACICNGEVELDNPEVIPTRDMSMNLPLIGGVSFDICSKLSSLYPRSKVVLLPALVRSSRFKTLIRTRDNRLDSERIKTAGFVGLSSYDKTPSFNAIKRPEMFLEICKKANLVPKFTETLYTYDTIESFYKSVDIVICTSTSEGGPMGLFEAIYCGIPVISTNVGMVKDILTIPKFSTVDEAVGLIGQIRHYSVPNVGLVQAELESCNFTFEKAIGRWETFFYLAAKEAVFKWME